MPKLVTWHALIGHVVEGVDEDGLHVAWTQAPHQHRVHVSRELLLVVPAANGKIRYNRRTNETLESACF